MFCSADTVSTTVVTTLTFGGAIVNPEEATSTDDYAFARAEAACPLTDAAWRTEANGGGFGTDAGAADTASATAGPQTIECAIPIEQLPQPPPLP